MPRAITSASPISRGHALMPLRLGAYLCDSRCRIRRRPSDSVLHESNNLLIHRIRMPLQKKWLFVISLDEPTVEGIPDFEIHLGMRRFPLERNSAAGLWRN